MKNVAGQAVPAFAEIELLQGTAPSVLVVDEIQREDGLVDAPNLGDGLRQRGGSIVHLQGKHDAHGGDESELERVDKAQHVVLVRRDPVEVDALPGQSIEITVVGVRIDAPKAATADVSQAGAEAIAQQLEQAGNDIAVGAGVGHDLGGLQLARNMVRAIYGPTFI